ncbi:MAG TPA: hypothetical protein VGR55_16340 [Candidatus Acidoferrum sp.]|nr:hypothetical protein [Candidatus Acidoferrum sp.]
MGVQEARQFFLNRIEKQLSEEGRPLDGLELRYWKALIPEHESEVDEMRRDRATREALVLAGKNFEKALYDAIAHDLSVDSAATSQYLRALEQIKCLDDGVQLQALAFAAAMKFKELTGPYVPWVRWLVAAILVMLGIGIWLAMR